MQEKIKTIIKTLDNKQAENIQVIKVTDLTVITDYFVIANGNSSTHTKALADYVEEAMSKMGVEPKHTEGKNDWIVLDYADVIVHVFYKETREYYKLERLWSDGELVDIKQFMEE